MWPTTVSLELRLVRPGVSGSFHSCDIIFSDDTHSIKLGLADGSIKAQPDDFPCFLYFNEKVSDDDAFEGFLKGDLLVKVRHPFIQGSHFSHFSSRAICIS